MLLPHFGLFFFNDTATTEIYTLSYTTLFRSRGEGVEEPDPGELRLAGHAWSRSGILGRLDDGPEDLVAEDRKSTRLNSSHGYISYAVFCLKKKTNPKASAEAAPPCRLEQ